MVHLGPEGLVGSAPYRAWLAGLGPAWRHVLVNAGQAQNPVLRRAARLQAQLNWLHPAVFPRCALVPDAPAPAPAAGDADAAVLPGHDGLRFTLTPTHKAGVSLEGLMPPMDVEAVQRELREAHPELQAQLDAARAAAAAAPGLPGGLAAVDEAGGFRLTFLGTTSAVPQGYRNVSGAYLATRAGAAGLLVDVGEDSYGQLQRCLGPAGAAAALGGLAAVWVSHMHADHHGGLYALLQRRAEALGPGAPPLLVIGPWPLLKVLQSYASALPPLRFLFLPSNHFAQRAAPGYRPPPPHILAAYDAALAALGLAQLEPFPVEHVNNSFGLAVRGAAGWSVVFSADTRPCDAVAAAAAGATLLVHEATFEDELAAEAAAKRHSTTGEALGVWAASGAYRLVLTHFSSRYPKLPVLGDGPGARAAAVAFDFMTLGLRDLPGLPALTPVLGRLLAAQAAEFETAADDGVAGIV
jgi:ribonuclease Z